MNYEEYINSIKLLRLYNHHYYTLDAPLVSDSIYDALYNKIKKYEKNNPMDKTSDSVTEVVGGIVLDTFKKIKHYSKMYSLDNLFTRDDLKKWLSNKNTDIYLDPKYDGVSLNLIYDKGKLIDAITRGDGESGESVYENALNIIGIPKTIGIESLIEIRGEVIITTSEFNEINKYNKNNGLITFSNPRNLAAGTLRQLDSNVVKKRNLKFYPYNVGVNNMDFKYHTDIINFFIENNFNEPIFQCLVSNFDDIEKCYGKINNSRDSIDIPLDGVVLKINDISKYGEYGYTNKYPLHSIAYKFPPTKFLTKVLDIVLQISRLGVITPVAIVEDTLIDGVTISKATLHNFNEIKRKDIRIGDMVVLIRSGDVIPKIIESMPSLRVGDVEEYSIPTICPSCNKRLVKYNSDIVCTNETCRDIVIEKLSYFVSKDGLNIPDISKQTIIQLYDILSIRSYVDLLRVNDTDLLKVNGFSNKKASKLYNSIRKTTHIDYWRFINSLGIHGVGNKISKDVASLISDSFVNIIYTDLEKIRGIGDNVVRSISKYITDNRNMILELEQILKPKIVKSNGVLNNLTITVTGKLPVNRDMLIGIIESNGGVYSTTITKATNILVTEVKTGKKYTKAKSIGMDILTFQEFVDKYSIKYDIRQIKTI